MSYVVQRCETCGEVIDPDDKDYSKATDHPELCALCNEAYRSSL